MKKPEPINQVVKVVIDSMLRDWARSRGGVISELEMEDQPMPSGMTGADLAAYFEMRAKRILDDAEGEA